MSWCVRKTEKAAGLASFVDRLEHSPACSASIHRRKHPPQDGNGKHSLPRPEEPGELEAPCRAAYAKVNALRRRVDDDHTALWHRNDAWNRYQFE